MPIERGNALFAAWFFAVATVIIAPLAVIDTPLLADYPNHVARMHVLGNLDHGFFLKDRYAISFDLIPNIAMDLAVPWLARWVPLDIAARLFLAVCLISTLVGVAWLHRILFNRWSSFSLIAALFAYHGSLMAGMVNFSLGIGLVPAALALWIRMQDARAAWRLLVGATLALLLFFCHLVAVGGFGLLVMGTALARARDDRRRAVSEFAIVGASGFLPALLFARLVFSAEGGAPAAGVVYGDLGWKLKALLAPLANYNLALDLVSFAAIVGLFLAAWWTGRLRVDRRIAPGFALLALGFVIAPKALWTGGVFDQRLAVLLALILVASSHIALPAGALSRALPAGLALLFLARIGVLTSAWLDHRDDLAEMRSAADLIAPGGRVLVVRPDRKTGQRLAPARHRVFHHAVQLPSLPAVAVVEKDAFVSTLYALPGQQPLVLKPPFDRLGGRGHVDLPTIKELSLALRSDARAGQAKRQIQDWPSDFDYVVMIYGYGPGAAAFIGDLPLEPLLDGDILDLFRVIKR